jgi:nucleoporin NUP82
VSADPEEPLQTIAFIPERKSRSYGAEDPAAREAVSFTLGSGDGDWSPFTLYVATRSGDVYANCPFMPVNACVLATVYQKSAKDRCRTLPSGSLFALDGFVAAKQHFLSATYSAEGARVSKMSVLYDQQRRYVTALLRQLPGDVTPTSLSRPVSVNAPPSGKRIPSRQGPFVLRPAPSSMIDEDGDMTDIQYLTAGSDTEMDEHGRRHELGIMIITSQDGHTNVCLDLDKVEARWDSEVRH